MDKKLTILDILGFELKEQNSLNLHCLCGRKGLVRELTIPDLNRPGLALSGFYESFAAQRIQLFGRGEVAFLKKLAEENNYESIEKFFSYQIPCCIFTHNLLPNERFLKIADDAGCAVLQTDLSSSEFNKRLVRILSDVFAPSKTMHGVLLEVYGVGILITGESGVGKSETALELIERGQRLVADDVVEISCINGSILKGTAANKIIGHHMEIRGLGIINITQLYGVGSVRDQKEIQLIIKLEEWNPDKVYDRLGNEEKTMNILGVHVPMLEIPVKPGRNVPIIIETAAMNERLKSMGYYSAKEFNKNVLKWIETNTAKTTYYKDE